MSLPQVESPIKAIIINVLIPLLVTVIGGIIVFQYANKDKKSEAFSYTVSERSRFEFSSRFFTTSSLTIDNMLPQRIVGTKIFVNLDSPFSEYEISHTSNHNLKLRATVTDNNKSLLIEVEEILSQERIEIDFLFVSDRFVNATYQVRSRDQLAKQLETSEVMTRINNDLTRLILIVLASGLLSLLASMLTKRFFRDFVRTSSAMNNTAFALLHQGLISEAKIILQNNITTRGASPYELSNLALCLAMEGEFDKAKSTLDAAIFLADDAGFHNVAFNRALILYISGDKEEARSQLKKYKIRNPRQFSYYYKWSLLLRDAVKELGLT
jgi:tetratricopeptide (TPR) repeat protein